MENLLCLLDKELCFTLIFAFVVCYCFHMIFKSIIDIFDALIEYLLEKYEKKKKTN